jgi:hypothetical protein
MRKRGISNAFPHVVNVAPKVGEKASASLRKWLMPCTPDTNLDVQTHEATARPLDAGSRPFV